MRDRFLSRRTFLKGAVAGAFLLVSSQAFASELLNPEESAPGEFVDALDETERQEILGDMTKEGRLVLNCARTKEKLDVVFRNAAGEYDPEALKAINHLMRCHYRDEEADMDIQVLEYLNALDNRIRGGGNEIEVISGYRSKEYNTLLRKRSRRVAKHSFHLTGQAIDFRIPSISTKKIRQTALKMGYGGVGYYPRRHFVHIDSGRFRWW